MLCFFRTWNSAAANKKHVDFSFITFEFTNSVIIICSEFMNVQSLLPTTRAELPLYDIGVALSNE